MIRRWHAPSPYLCWKTKSDLLKTIELRFGGTHKRVVPHVPVEDFNKLKSVVLANSAICGQS